LKEDLAKTKVAAQDSIKITAKTAQEGIREISLLAHQEIDRIKIDVKERAGKEVDNFVKSPEIQRLINRRVTEEIEKSYFKDISVASKIQDASTKMRDGELKGMMILMDYGQNAENLKNRKLASELLRTICLDLMKRQFILFDYNRTPPEPNYKAIEEDQRENAYLNYIRNGLEFYEGTGNFDLDSWVTTFEAMNYTYGKNFSICEYKEAIEFLESYKK
jgi:hypothetical protein